MGGTDVWALTCHSLALTSRPAHTPHTHTHTHTGEAGDDRRCGDGVPGRAQGQRSGHRPQGLLYKVPIRMWLGVHSASLSPPLSLFSHSHIRAYTMRVRGLHKPLWFPSLYFLPPLSLLSHSRARACAHTHTMRIRGMHRRFLGLPRILSRMRARTYLYAQDHPLTSPPTHTPPTHTVSRGETRGDRLGEDRTSPPSTGGLKTWGPVAISCSSLFPSSVFWCRFLLCKCILRSIFVFLSGFALCEKYARPWWSPQEEKRIYGGL